MSVVYIMNITPLLDKKVFDDYIDKVDEARQKKIKKLKLPLAKAQSLGVGLLLRYAVENNVDLEYNSLVFLTEDGGKPYVEGDPFYFSLSHSGDYAVCAISDSPVGVDIEKEKELSEKIKGRFAKNTVEWTEKEAKGKLTGNGFFDDTKDDFVFSHHKTTDGYIITVCSDKKFDKFIEKNVTRDMFV